MIELAGGRCAGFEQLCGAGLRIHGRRHAPHHRRHAVRPSGNSLSERAVRQRAIARGETHLRACHRELAVEHRRLQRSRQRNVSGGQRVWLGLLPVAAHVVEIRQFAQGREQVPTVEHRRPHARLAAQHGQPGEGAQHALRRDEARLVGFVVRPFDIRRGGAGRHGPVVADAVAPRRELDLDAVFQLHPACCGVGQGRRHLCPTFPATYARVVGKERLVQRAGLGRQVDGDDIARRLQHLHQRAGLPEQLVRVVKELDPAAGGDGKRRIAPDAGDFELIGRGLAQPAGHARDDAAVVARPLEAHLARGAAVVVNLDAVELVFQAPVTGFGREQAGVLRRHAGYGAGGESAIGRFGERVPGLIGDAVQRVAQIAGAQQLHLPHELVTRGGVRHAQRHFAQQRVFQRRDVAQPGFDVADVGPVGRVHRIAGGVVDLDLGQRRRIGRRHGEQAGARGHHRRDLRLQPRLRNNAQTRHRLAQQALHIAAARADAHVLARAGQLESGVVDRRCGASAERVQRLCFDAAVQDVLLLVPLGIQLHPALLHAHGAVVLVGSGG